MRQNSFDFGETMVLPQIRERLLAVFGPQRDEYRFDPLNQLIYGIVASTTRDEVSMAAFLELQRRYRPWDMLMKATPRRSSASFSRFIMPIAKPRNCRKRYA